MRVVGFDRAKRFSKIARTRRRTGRKGIDMEADDVGPRLRSAAIVLAAWLAAVGSASAQKIPGYPEDVNALDPRETAMLPKFCAYTQRFRTIVPGGDNPTALSEWEAVFGAEIFHHMHHYCLGLMKTNRAVLLSRDPAVRRFYLGDSIIEFDYVINRAAPDFVLLPEILTKKAQNLVLLGKGPAAVLEFLRAIETKKDYWPPYAYLSDYYVETGDRKKATEVLKEGLSQVPSSSALQRRLDEIGQTKRKP
jgi:tetratricopeptide (TPR) repeat protein